MGGSHEGAVVKRAVFFGLTTTLGFVVVVLGSSLFKTETPTKLAINIPYDAVTCPVGDNAIFEGIGNTAEYSFATIASAWAYYQPEVVPHLAVPASTFVIVGAPSDSQAQVAYLDLGTGQVFGFADLFNGSVADGSSGWYVEGAQVCSTLLTHPSEPNITESVGTATETPTPVPIPTRG